MTSSRHYRFAGSVLYENSGVAHGQGKDGESIDFRRWNLSRNGAGVGGKQVAGSSAIAAERPRGTDRHHDWRVKALPDDHAAWR